MMPNGDLLQMLHEVTDAVLADEMNLSDWETRFVEDMAPKFRLARFVPSEKQQEIVVKLWNRSKGRV